MEQADFEEVLRKGIKDSVIKGERIKYIDEATFQPGISITFELRFPIELSLDAKMVLGKDEIYSIIAQTIIEKLKEPDDK